MADDMVKFAGGKVTSSKVPPFHLIPLEAQVRLAWRFQTGIDRRPDGTAWNACSKNQEVLLDQAFVLDRISHVIKHANLLRDKIIAGTPMEGDDDAGAIAWCGAFFCCATRAMADAQKGSFNDGKVEPPVS